MPDTVRYASAEDVLLALDKEPAQAKDTLEKQAKKRAEAATQNWINRTQHPFHDVRTGNTDEPRSWEIHDVHDAETWDPVRVMLDNKPILPLDPDEGDAIEVRTGRGSWDDITGEEGDEWALDYRTGRLLIYRRRLNLVPFDDPNTRFLRVTYRYGPLGEMDDVTITEDGLVESVPPDVVSAVAAKAAMRLVLQDELRRSTHDDGQLTDRSTKRSDYKAEWENTTAEYTGFSTL